MAAVRADFVAGMRDISPILLGVIPFGTITGVAMASVMPTREALGMSLLVFAGASQLAAVQLLSSGGAFFVILLTTLVINLRFVMYSASIAPHLKPYSARWKLPLAYLLTDQCYAISIMRFTRTDEPVHKAWYVFGTAITPWVAWQASSIAGIFLGAQVPASWSLDFAIPLTFLALLVPAIRTRPTLVAALVGATVAIAARGLPYNAGLLTGAFSGILAGLLAEGRM